MNNQPVIPDAGDIEQARLFAPNYDTELTFWALDPSEWQHMLPCRFGPARQCSWSADVKWTGDAYRYDIYQREVCGGTKYAVRWENGSGCGWLVCDNRAKRDEYSIIDMIAALPDEARRWDACHFLWETAHKTELAARKAEYSTVARAFVEKRLRKTKVRGRDEYRVTVENVTTSRITQPS